jgi:hypothetical protein
MKADIKNNLNIAGSPDGIVSPSQRSSSEFDVNTRDIAIGSPTPKIRRREIL